MSGVFCWPEILRLYLANVREDVKWMGRKITKYVEKEEKGEYIHVMPSRINESLSKRTIAMFEKSRMLPWQHNYPTDS